ncbi:hypothetical protein LR69_02050 [Geobacillus sp. BCO2]|nr:hypothetical protein LR69_02050 [Geobacillus sp. BCO2]
MSSWAELLKGKVAVVTGARGGLGARMLGACRSGGGCRHH